MCRWPSAACRLWAATADAALLSAVMARYAFLARRVDQTAAVLAIPEAAWIAFATVLSTAVAAKNGLLPQARIVQAAMTTALASPVLIPIAPA